MIYIAKMGVELEGGWRHRKDRESGFHGDSSVDVYSEDDGRHECDGDCEDDCVISSEPRIAGEFVSPPSTVKELAEFMDKHYPDDIDESCGMHVHFSFVKEGHYGTLMEPRFYGYFLRMMQKFGEEHKLSKSDEFWERLAGKNNYCCNNRKSNRTSVGYRRLVESQVYDRTRNETRYHHLNFCKALHGTLEVRLLPMFNDKKLAIEAIHYLAWIIESYLAKRKRNKVFKKELFYEEQEPHISSSEIDLGKELICAS